MSNKIYAFNYTSCIHESAPETISLHYSESGAIGAMISHKNKELEDFNRSHEGDHRLVFGKFERWEVKEVKIMP